jgi:hypothetical protein
MPLNAKYLKELSHLFVEDLKRSDYYRKLPDNERRDLDDRISSELAEGRHPLLPGAEEEDLQKLSKAIQQKLHVRLPVEVIDVLRQVDGFSENGVTLYGIDPELRDDQFDTGPSLLAENLVNWGSVPVKTLRYLFVGDSDLWYFAIELATGYPVVLDKATLKQVERFASMEELVNEMMEQALGDYFEDPEDEPGSHSTGFHFSSN